MSIASILMLLAAVCFLCAALGVQSARVNLIALGLLIWVLSTFVRS